MNEAQSNIEFRYRFEAAHRLTSAESMKCQTPHGHTWHVTATFTLQPERAALGPSAMAAEFSLLKKGIRSFVDETADHSFFVNHMDPLYRVATEIVPNIRSLELPCDPTTEAIAAAFAFKFSAMHNALPTSIKETIRLTGIRIQETPTNSIDIRWPFDGSFPNWGTELLGAAKGWWNSADPLDRSPISIRK